MRKKTKSAASAVERIHRQYGAFTETNRRLADFFLDNLEMATFKSVGELKTMTGVSDATIIRFAYDLGYASFKEFREDLAEYIRKIIYSKTPDPRPFEKGETLLDQVVEADINHITRTMAAVDRARFARLVDMVVAAERVWVMGGRSSSFAAELLAFQLTRLGRDARAVVRERRPLLEQALDIRKGDLVMAFDLNPYAPDIHDAVDHLSRNLPDVPLATMTSDPLARIVPYADLSFFLDLGGQKDFTLTSLSALTCFINAVVESVCAIDPARAGEKMRAYEETVLTRPAYAMSLHAVKRRGKNAPTAGKKRPPAPPPDSGNS